MEEISFSIEMIDVKLLTGLVHIFELVVACHPMVGAMCNSLSYDSKDFRTPDAATRRQRRCPARSSRGQRHGGGLRPPRLSNLGRHWGRSPGRTADRKSVV